MDRRIPALSESQHVLRFRHVVFADAATVRRRPVDLSRYAIAPRAARQRPSPSPAGDGFLRWMLQQAGIEGGRYREETLRRRLPSCLRALRVTSPIDARRVLQRHPRLLHSALSATLIGVTSFFRDAAVFATLRETVLPALLARPHPLRVWSVGCSDGAELYSVAMLLAESGALERARLLGTDCRADAIGVARAARYDASAMKTVAVERQARHFIREGLAWRVADALRNAARFRVGNVFAGAEPGHWDVILCRNVAIYLDDVTARDLWRCLDRCMRPGSVLVVGKAERPTAGTFEVIGPCLYRRTMA